MVYREGGVNPFFLCRFPTKHHLSKAAVCFGPEMATYCKEELCKQVAAFGVVGAGKCLQKKDLITPPYLWLHFQSSSLWLLLVK